MRTCTCVHTHRWTHTQDQIVFEIQVFGARTVAQLIERKHKALVSSPASRKLAGQHMPITQRKMSIQEKHKFQVILGSQGCAASGILGYMKPFSQ